jgi:hypothetical protein
MPMMAKPLDQQYDSAFMPLEATWPSEAEFFNVSYVDAYRKVMEYEHIAGGPCAARGQICHDDL